MTPCTFCQILAGELPSSFVLDDALVVGILDICPVNPGHTLVMPRRHVEFFADLTETEVAHLALAGQRVATALRRGFESCAAVTFSLADGAAAGQDVPHTHLHVIPRHTGDGFGWRAAGALEDRETLDATASRLRAALDVTSKPG
jgi:histidine triad (HIT) family protein